MPKYLASLKGETQTISMRELRRNPGSVMTAVECGKVFIITRWGRPIAKVSKITGGEEDDKGTNA